MSGDLLQSAKNSLKIIVGEQCVNDEPLLNFIAEVEFLLNSRLLTHLSDDCRDEETLIPNHFLLSRASPNLSPAIVTAQDAINRKSWKHAQVMTQKFISIFLETLGESWPKICNFLPRFQVLLYGIDFLCLEFINY